MSMHYCSHDFARWALDTQHMNRIEKSIYLDMRTLVFTGKGIIADLPMLYRHLNAHSNEEKEAVTFLLRDKFKLDKRSNTYKHKEWEQELKNYKYAKRKNSNANSNANSNGQSNANSNESNGASNAERQAKLRNEKKQIKAFLSSKNVDIKGVTSIVKLRELAESNGYSNEKSVTDNAESNATSNGQSNADDNGNNATNPSHNLESKNLESKNLNKKNKTKKNDAIALIDFWNERAGQSVTYKTWKSNIEARLKNFEASEIEKAMLFVINNPWYRENNQVSINNVISSDKRLEDKIQKANQPLYPQQTGNQNANSQSYSNASTTVTRNNADQYYQQALAERNSYQHGQGNSQLVYVA